MLTLSGLGADPCDDPCSNPSCAAYDPQICAAVAPLNVGTAPPAGYSCGQGAMWQAATQSCVCPATAPTWDPAAQMCTSGMTSSTTPPVTQPTASGIPVAPQTAPLIATSGIAALFQPTATKIGVLLAIATVGGLGWFFYNRR